MPTYRVINRETFEGGIVKAFCAGRAREAFNWPLDDCSVLRESDYPEMKPENLDEITERFTIPTEQ